jgi:putative tricarboxylic transport membrane protein
MRRLILASLAAAFSVVLASAGAHAQFQPSKPIEFVVHGGPGSGNDLFARALIAMMEQEKLATVRFQVANRPGGGSTTAAAYLNGKSGDSHTIGVFTNVWLTDPLTQSAANVVIYKDLTPIARMVLEPGLVVVKADSPFKALGDFVKAAKDKPKTLKQSGGSITSRENIIRQIIMKQTGADWAFISFPSGSERLAALLGGHVELMILDPSEAIEQVRAGKIRVVAQIADSRLPAFKDIPTVPEAGYPLPPIPQVRGIVGPPNMPADALAYYEGLVEKIVATASWKKYLLDNYFEGKFAKSAETKKFLQEYEGDIRKQLQEVGAKLAR